MYSNYFLIDRTFLDLFSDQERIRLAEFIYSLYLKCGSQKSKKLPIDDYFKSTRIKYPVVYALCPKCKISGFMPIPFGKKSTEGLKYCPHCGEPNISYRYEVGRQKIIPLLNVSRTLEKDQLEVSINQNQQLLVLISSVYEVYLREFYADILNCKFVRQDHSLYTKFIRDCKNDFLNPGKTQDRMKKELGIDYKSIIGTDAYKMLNLLSEYRNVIVHNNGICDSIFVKQHPEIELRSKIAPRCNFVIGYLHVMDHVVNTLDMVYQQTILEQVIYNLKIQINMSGLSIKPS